MEISEDISWVMSKMTSRDGNCRNCTENCRSGCDVIADSRCTSDQCKAMGSSVINTGYSPKKIQVKQIFEIPLMRIYLKPPGPFPINLSHYNQVNYAQIDREVAQPSQNPGKFQPGYRPFDIRFGRKFVYFLLLYVLFHWDFRTI